jgi:uncharacterized protein YciI
MIHNKGQGGSAREGQCIAFARTTGASMPYMIETFDKPGTGELRQELRPAHLDFLEQNKNMLLACGAKLQDDGSTGTGSFYIVDVETREEAQAFIDQDPFTQGGLFERMEINRWRKAYLNRESYL